MSVAPLKPEASSRSLHWVRPPQQERSRQTLARFLDAAEELLCREGVKALTVSRVAKRAGASVGAFYARFKDKDALIKTLHERIHEETLATAAHAFEPSRWEGVLLVHAIPEIVAFVVAEGDARRGMGRAFTRAAADIEEIREQRGELAPAVARHLLGLLAARRTEIAHPDLAMASEFLTRLVLGFLDTELRLYDPGAPQALSNLQLSAELSRAAIGYLGLAPTTSPTELRSVP